MRHRTTHTGSALTRLVLIVLAMMAVAIVQTTILRLTMIAVDDAPATTDEMQ